MALKQALNPEATPFFPSHKSLVSLPTPPPPPVYISTYETYPVHFLPPPPSVVSLPLPPPPPQPPQPRSHVTHSSTQLKKVLTPVPSGPRMTGNGFYRFRRDGGGRGRGSGRRGGRLVFGRVDRERNVQTRTVPIIPTPNPNSEKNCTSHRGLRCMRQLKKSFHQEIMPLNPTVEATTVMIRNIPNKYSRKQLLDFLDNHCRVENEKAKEEKNKDDINDVSSYDFLYLPIDFCHRLNAGYAFVNFTNAKAVWKFHDAFDGKSWELFESPKKMNITQARIQGKEELISHFEKRQLCCGSDEYLPVSFDPPRDGSGRYTKTNNIGKSWKRNLNPNPNPTTISTSQQSM